MKSFLKKLFCRHSYIETTLAFPCDEYLFMGTDDSYLHAVSLINIRGECLKCNKEKLLKSFWQVEDKFYNLKDIKHLYYKIRGCLDWDAVKIKKEIHDEIIFQGYRYIRTNADDKKRID